MSQKYVRLLNAVFQEPVSANLHWRDIESLMKHLGATIEPGHGARMRISLNEVEGSLHRPHHSGACSKHDIRHLREFLKAAGVDPTADENSQ